MQHTEIRDLDLSFSNGNVVEEILANCFDGIHAVMDESTFCIWDVRPYEIAGVKSVLIQKNGLMYTSDASSNLLVEDFAKSKGSYHEMTCLVASVLEIHQKVPYIIGERCFMPLDGYTKAPTTWIRLNHAERVTYDGANKKVHLMSHQRFVLTIEMAKSTFEKHLERAARILQYKLSLHHGQMEAYSYYYRPPHYIPTNIVSETLKRISYELPTFTYFEMEQQVRLHEEKKRVKAFLGEDNPYYEDYLNHINESQP